MCLGEPSPLELSIVMPCLNEAEALPFCITKAQQFLREHGICGEIIVADNGSTDGSQTLAAKMGVRVVPVATRGYGSAIMGGILAAQGKFIIMGDADGSYDFMALLPFVERLREGCDLVMGNRFKGGIGEGAMPILHKYLGNPVLTRLGQLLFRSSVGDFHCGLRGFSKAAIMQMDLRTTGMEFASEMVLKASLFGMKTAEVPTTLSPDRRSRPPHLRTWRDGWRHLRFMLLYSPRWLFFYPGAALMLLGLLLGLWLLPGPRTLGNITFDVHTLLYSALVFLIGFQAVEFAFFTKIFAITEGLLPEDPRLNKLFRFVTLEFGLALGSIMLIGGLIGSLYMLFGWQAKSFGRLEPSQTMRFVIPAVVLIALGCQIILSSFFFSVLGLRRR